MIELPKKPHYKLNVVKKLIRNDRFNYYSSVHGTIAAIGFFRVDVKEFFLKHLTVRDFDKQMMHDRYNINSHLHCMVDVYKSVFKSRQIYTKFCINYHVGRAHPSRPKNYEGLQSLDIQSFKQL